MPYTKHIALVAAPLLSLSLAACGGTEASSGGRVTNSTSPMAVTSSDSATSTPPPAANNSGSPKVAPDTLECGQLADTDVSDLWHVATPETEQGDDSCEVRKPGSGSYTINVNLLDQSEVATASAYLASTDATDQPHEAITADGWAWGLVGVNTQFYSPGYVLLTSAPNKSGKALACMSVSPATTTAEVKPTAPAVITACNSVFSKLTSPVSSDLQSEAANRPWHP